MKKNRFLLYALLIATPYLSSCTGLNMAITVNPNINTNPSPEYTYSDAMFFRGGLVYHKNTTAGQLGNATALRSGRSCSKSFLWLVAWGDSSIETAKNTGNIKRIASIDHESMAILGALYHRHCTIITGE